MVIPILRTTKKLAVQFADWALYKAIPTKQKQQIANLFTQEQKNKIKKLIRTGNKRTQLRKVERQKHKLYSLGFYQKGYEDLLSIFQETTDSYLKQLAGWELAIWHANQYTKEDARLCIQFLDTVTKNAKDKENLKRAAVLKAESYGILDKKAKGMQTIHDTLKIVKHPDLYLAAASLEDSLTSKIEWINQAYQYDGETGISVERKEGLSLYDGFQTLHVTSNQKSQNQKVTVIIPAYNAEKVIITSIDSVLNQTWKNLEVFVVDDCSTDNTAKIVKEYEKIDHRIKLLQSQVNSGAYVCRNLALQMATGDFVTINDADDWSHAKKIETQVSHLIKNKQIVGNLSQQARATEDLIFFRRGKPGMYIFSNMSSFMFRRVPVMEKIGYWDCVRFMGDSEFIKRVKLVFGEKSVVDLHTAPLSFQRQSVNSLTAHSAFGFPGYFMGARKEYKEAFENFHQKNELYYSFPMKKRPFLSCTGTNAVGAPRKNGRSETF